MHPEINTTEFHPKNRWPVFNKFSISFYNRQLITSITLYLHSRISCIKEHCKSLQGFKNGCMAQSGWLLSQVQFVSCLFSVTLITFSHLPLSQHLYYFSEIHPGT